MTNARAPLGSSATVSVGGPSPGSPLESLGGRLPPARRVGARGGTGWRADPARVAVACSGLAILVSFATAAWTSGLERTLAPVSPWVRAPLAVAWAGIQLLTLAAAFSAPARAFTGLLAVLATAGTAFMTLGRLGLSGSGWVAWFACLSVVMPVVLAMGLLTHARRNSRVILVLRLFFFLSVTGVVYLHGVQPAESMGQVRAIAASLAVVGLLVSRAHAAERVLTTLTLLRGHSVVAVLWAASAGLLVVNGLAMHATGQNTPQVSLVGVSVAPYMMAALLGLMAVALQFRNEPGLRGLVGVLFGCALVGTLYVGLLREAGTFAMFGLAAVGLAVLLARPLVAVITTVAVSASLVLLRLPAVVHNVAALDARLGERLAAWAHLQPVPDQLARVTEVLQGSGCFGHVGAARLGFLVGQQATKDFMPVLVVAQGGWVGGALVVGATLLCLGALRLVASGPTAPLTCAVQSATFSMIAANLLISLAWLADVFPFAGIPMPIVARGGSHLMVIAVAVALVDLLTGEVARRA